MPKAACDQAFVVYGIAPPVDQPLSVTWALSLLPPARREESNRFPTGKPWRTLPLRRPPVRPRLIFLNGTPGFEWQSISDLCHALGLRQPPALLCPTEKDASPVYAVLPRTDGLSWGRPSLNGPLFADHLGAGLCPWNASWARKSLGSPPV